MTHLNLTCDAFEAALPDYLEETLSDSALADAELHLAACAACRALVADLRGITREAAALPGIAPSRDLWPAIEARTHASVLPFAPAHAARTWGPRRLGAIAAALVGVTALGTWQLATHTRTEAPSEVAASAPVEAPAMVPATTPGTTAIVTPVRAARRPRLEAGATYTTEIERLRAVLSTRAAELDPATVTVLQQSMATIDSAITQARAALARDPGSRFLNEQLNHSLERKLGLLRTAALLPST